VVRVDSTAIDRFDTSRFEAGRNRLASLAYRLLGSANDAEDAVLGVGLAQRSTWPFGDTAVLGRPHGWVSPA
jgi:RNA polymerase sigma-70 factor (ECF subfamily)